MAQRDLPDRGTGNRCAGKPIRQCRNFRADPVYSKNCAITSAETSTKGLAIEVAFLAIFIAVICAVFAAPSGEGFRPEVQPTAG